MIALKPGRSVKQITQENYTNLKQSQLPVYQGWESVQVTNGVRRFDSRARGL